MKDWQQRVKDEYEDLSNRRIRLYHFLYIGKENANAEGISDEQWELLDLQHSAMRVYEGILKMRMKDFPDD